MRPDNTKPLTPSCRPVEEGKKFLKVKMPGRRHNNSKDGLEVYNGKDSQQYVNGNSIFSNFDGFSIGFNDLTQLSLGLDKDSYIVSDLFNENEMAVKKMIVSAIHFAKEPETHIGLCG